MSRNLSIYSSYLTCWHVTVYSILLCYFLTSVILVVISSLSLLILFIWVFFFFPPRWVWLKAYLFCSSLRKKKDSSQFHWSFQLFFGIYFFSLWFFFLSFYWLWAFVLLLIPLDGGLDLRIFLFLGVGLYFCELPA